MRSFAIVSLLVLGSSAIGAAQTQPAEARRRWLVTTGGSFVRLGDDLGFGPSAGIRGMLSRRFGLTLDGAVLVTGFGASADNLTGLFGSVGSAWVWRGVSQEVSVSLGVSAATKWEDSGFPPGARGQASSVGVFAATGGVIWLGSTVGLSGTVRYHLWWGEPGASATFGIAFRW